MNEEKLKEMMCKWLNKEEVAEISKYLKEKGKTVYSISRLSTYSNCKLDYFLTYVMGNYGEQNIYSANGSAIHDHLEKIYENEETVEQMREEYPDQIAFNKLFYPFPSKSIEESWEKDMLQFIKDFKKQDYPEIYCERGFVIEIAEDVYCQGWLDVTIVDENNDYHIIDYKTSSLYQGEAIKEHGYQLLLYALAVKKIENKYPKSVSWFFLKYYNLTDLNTGKTSMVNRGSWVKKISGKITTQLKKMGMYDEMLLDVAIRQNDISLLPKEIQDRYKLEDCYVYYDITKENMEELYDYLIGTITEIESRDKDNTMLWQPNRQSADFFCINLCSNYDKCHGKGVL